MAYRPELNRPYTSAQMDEILSDAVRVLGEVGIGCAEKDAIDRITATPGVRWHEGRLRFGPETVRETVAAIRRENATGESEPPAFRLHTAWSCFNYADPETGEVRPPSTADAIRMTRLMDARGYGWWPIPLIPRDVPPRHATLACEHIALRHSRHFGGFMPALCREEIDFLIAMYQAVGRTYLHNEQISISPLRFNDAGLALAIPYLGRDDCQVILTGAIPAVGATAPFSIRTALVQVLAEQLALVIACGRLGLREKGVGLRLQPFDFQATTMVFGGPEEMLFRTCCNQLTEHVAGVPARWGHLHSMARMPDVQAAAERAASALWQGLIGVREFHCAGQLAQDEVFSPLQVVIDEEIIRLVGHACRGLEPLAADGEDAVAEIAAGLAAGTFLAEPATAGSYRNVSYWPELFSRATVGHWHRLGQPTILGEARAAVAASLAAHTFSLEAAQADQLDLIYGEARRAIRP